MNDFDKYINSLSEPDKSKLRQSYNKCLSDLTIGVDAVQTTLNTFKQQIENIAEQEAFLQICEAEGDEFQKEIAIKKLVYEHSDFYNKSVEILKNLYEAIAATAGNYNHLTPLYHTNTECFDCSGVVIKSQNDVVCIGMPHIPLKVSTRPYDRRFGNALISVFKEYEQMIGFPYMEKKTVSFIHVYPENQNTRLLPDNDRYDYKHIIDVITDFTGGGDDALNCAITLETILDDSIPNGSYAVVRAENGAIRNCEAGAEFLRHFYTL
ncbi:MAG: hypothetical protein Q4G33_14795 [bacterium]|nr:hypothetical protein [bacterium]